MRIIKAATNAHFQKQKRNVKAIPLNLEETYALLVGLLEPVKSSFEEKANSPHHYELWTNHVFRSKSQLARYRKGCMFAAVMIFSRYVSFYFYPLYLNKELKDNLNTNLKPFLAGESCFHFKSPETIPLTELSKLIEDGFSFYKDQQWI
ncbi:MAG: hypothetical protein KF687_05860 [Cyclobacteriaceae bacterium]|nr:hypothetical protein [Cyclobacteriaceae bacterium]